MNPVLRFSGSVERDPAIDAWMDQRPRGADLPDPARLLEGTGKRMRHVKLRPPPGEVDAAALVALIEAAYNDMTRRRTISLIQIGANGEVQPLEQG